MGKFSSISTDNAPKAIGAYSQAVMINNMLFTSGQLGINSKTGAFEDGVKNQAITSMENIKAILNEQGLNMSDIIKCTIFMKDMNDFAVVNEVYASYFKEPFPARSAVEVARLPKDGLVEIEAIAVK